MVGFVNGRRANSLHMLGSVGSRYVGRFATGPTHAGKSLATQGRSTGTAVAAKGHLAELSAIVARFRVWNRARSQVDVSCGCSIDANFSGSRGLVADMFVGSRRPAGALAPATSYFLNNTARISGGDRGRTSQAGFQFKVQRLAKPVHSPVQASAGTSNDLPVVTFNDYPSERRLKQLPGWQFLTPEEVKVVRQCFPHYRVPGASSSLRPSWRYRGQQLPVSFLIAVVNSLCRVEIQRYG